MPLSISKILSSNTSKVCHQFVCVHRLEEEDRSTVPNLLCAQQRRRAKALLLPDYVQMCTIYIQQLRCGRNLLEAVSLTYRTSLLLDK